ncbi:ASCH domain-containing protein [Paraburkholderia tropica]|uniref:ASCH domain-containing protein n=1 Tax=Paraburkholderia tropica TaxID=92647 RepID=UPI002AAF6FA5|nr:ASCH domain-containing protein [Paraburkholderia tropica]
MKALSIRQPWAWLIANGHKDIENRTWSTKFRGPVLIHAGKGMTRDEYDFAKDFVFGGEGIPPELFFDLPEFNELERGGIVGIATITDCVPPALAKSPWHIDGSFGFQIADAKPTQFLPCKGALSFFDVAPEVLALVRGTREPQPIE